MKLLNLSRKSFHRAQAGALPRRDQQLLHAQLLQQNSELREAQKKSLNEMEELKMFQSSPPSTLLQDED